MNKFEVVKGLYRQNVYNVRSEWSEGYYGHFTCYFNADFSFFKVAFAGNNTNMTNFYPNENPVILEISKELKEVLIRILSEWTYSHIKPIEVESSESLRDIFKNPFDNVVAEIFKNSDK